VAHRPPKQTKKEDLLRWTKTKKTFRVKKLFFFFQRSRSSEAGLLFRLPKKDEALLRWKTFRVKKLFFFFQRSRSSEAGLLFRLPKKDEDLLRWKTK